ncbi:hypothetical protein KW805_02505 [Candidatus Pacearchaeota archaeon]|nr:hypothetical protein [Candidatus Pacearchaeota archaeon]
MKKGLSDVITAVLVIIIAIAAILLVWTFVKPVIKQSGERIETAQAAQNALAIQRQSVTIGDDTYPLMTLIVQRNAGQGNITGFSIVLEDAAGMSATFNYPNITLREYETVRIPVYYGNTSLHNITRVSVIPLVQTRSGSQVSASTASDTYSVSGSEPTTIAFAAASTNNSNSTNSTSHTICSNSQCISVSGLGANQCMTNIDCSQTSHAECLQNQCVSVQGAGANFCTLGSACTTNTTIPSPDNNWCGNTDINHDGSVTISDFIDVSAHFNEVNCTSPTWCANTDINRDGTTSISDFIDVSANFNRIDCTGIIDCTDTDRGRNYTTRGDTTFLGQVATDFCYNYDGPNVGECSGNSTGCVLVEHSCKATWDETYGHGFKEKYTCANGCSNGACIITGGSPLCFDPDRGLNYIDASIIVSQLGNQWADQCSIQNASGTTSVQACSGSNCYLSEFLCSSNYADPSIQQIKSTFDGLFYAITQCPNGCSNGACGISNNSFQLMNFGSAGERESSSRDINQSYGFSQFGYPQSRMLLGPIGPLKYDGANKPYYEFLRNASLDPVQVSVGGPTNQSVLVRLVRDYHGEILNFQFAIRKSDLNMSLESDLDGHAIIIKEGEKIHKNDLVMIPDYPYVVKVTTIRNQTTGYSSDGVSFADIGTGTTTYDTTLIAEGKGVVMFGSRPYNVTYNGTPSDDSNFITLDYPQTSGSDKMLSPRIKLSDGGSVAIGTLSSLGAAYNLSLAGSNPALLYFEKNDKNIILVQIRAGDPIPIFVGYSKVPTITFFGHIY